MQKIILSRTDNLGDVVLTLPMAGAIKAQLPDSQVFFIGKSYTKAIIEGSNFVDKFLDREEILQHPQLLKELQANAIIHVFPDKEIASLAKRVNIPIRIGTSHRLFHWFSCNKMVNLGRKNSDLHEAQLNLKLLQPLQLKTDYALSEIGKLYGMSKITPLPSEFQQLVSKEKFNLILHPKSKGSAREWNLENYQALIQLLPKEKFQFFITGTQAEGEKIKNLLPSIFNFENVYDLTGKLSLSQLVSFINEVGALVACSTGPLHIAAALGKKAIGIFPPMRPIHPQRWQPLGIQAQTLCLNKSCNDCKKSMDCPCIQSITPKQVANLFFSL
ncbi:MAG: lipopolysaccharide heptosyltransferase family protein [Cytophagales bacterium]|nr:MAG: lipopolysaccharide heptosyltransferase family protein [Cytophagales bacterium]